MYLLLIKDEDLHPEYLKLLQSISPAKPLELEAGDLPIIKQAFSLCTGLYERTGDKLYFPMLKDSCNALVALFLSQYLKRNTPPSKLSRFEAVENAFTRLLETQFIAMKRPADYAQQLHISISYLNECVRNVTGFPVSHHIQQRIILEAKRELYHLDKSVKEIAAVLGYDDYAYFSRLFTKIAGMSALSFSQQNRSSLIPLKKQTTINKPRLVQYLHRSFHCSAQACLIPLRIKFRDYAKCTKMVIRCRR